VERLQPNVTSLAMRRARDVQSLEEPVNRSQLATALGERTGMSRKQASDTLDDLLAIITETVASGEPVAISGFAKFRRVETKARMGRNPATGEPVKIKASKKARITPLKAFKEAVIAGKAPRKAAKKAPAKKAPAKKAAKRAPAKKAPAKKAARRAPAKKRR
jgi:DNA-binding protein HU-beta